MIEREEMQEVVKSYREPIELIIGSHSALDARYGARNYGLRSVIYTTKERARIYLQNPIVGEPDEVIDDLPELVKRDMICVKDPRDIRKDGRWKCALVIFDRYSDIVKYVDDLVDLECIQIPNRAFAVYIGSDERCSVIEEKFGVPIMGSRKLLKIENRGEIERDYYWFAEKAKIPYPKSYEFKIIKSGIEFKEPIKGPILMKAEHPSRKFEREFIFAADSDDLEEKVRREMKAGNLDREALETARVEEIVLGPHANFNFFFSPLDAEKDWGDVDDTFAELYGVSLEEARVHLANEFLSIDERRETILDGLKRLPVDVQLKLKKIPSFEVTAHLCMSLRESLLKDVHRFADAFLMATRKYEPPGLIGAWCLQVLITWSEVPGVAVEYGLYDVDPERKVFMHLPVTQDVAVRHGGGTNVHLGIGSQYANAKRQRRMSMGDRIALEIRRAWKERALEKIVT
jgi:5-formaminoimidazole-4-carboxamide-1-(beta)-D-ribofuranosyl 5'-monophosphate synthetase